MPCARFVPFSTVYLYSMYRIVLYATHALGFSTSLVAVGTCVYAAVPFDFVTAFKNVRLPSAASAALGSNWSMCSLCPMQRLQRCVHHTTVYNSVIQIHHVCIR